MVILGIETSCDETSAALVQDGKIILSNIIATSLQEHQKFGGVIPEIASRRQLDYIHRVVQEALQKANLSFDDIDAIAVTKTPGLIGSLLVGISFAKALSFALKKPFLQINHIQAHIYANYLVAQEDAHKSLDLWERLALPAMGLVVSGGHSSLFYIKDFLHYQLMGQTRDDAPGEAYDKVSRILGLGYPGGPVIDKMARAKKTSTLTFPIPHIRNSYDFSFSGLKTAVLYYLQKHQKDADFDVTDVAWAFQESVVKALLEKTIQACLQKKVKTLLIGGGVSANSALREQFAKKAQENGIEVSFPSMKLCMDNAAMIAGLGYHHLTNKESFAIKETSKRR